MSRLLPGFILEEMQGQRTSVNKGKMMPKRVEEPVSGAPRSRPCVPTLVGGTAVLHSPGPSSEWVSPLPPPLLSDSCPSHGTPGGDLPACSGPWPPVSPSSLDWGMLPGPPQSPPFWAVPPCVSASALLLAHKAQSWTVRSTHARPLGRLAWVLMRAPTGRVTVLSRFSCLVCKVGRTTLCLRLCA